MHGSVYVECHSVSPYVRFYSVVVITLDSDSKSLLVVSGNNPSSNLGRSCGKILPSREELLTYILPTREELLT